MSSDHLTYIIHQSIDLSQLMSYFADHVGMVFLQDDQYPILGIYPKWLQSDKDRSCQQRQDDFSYHLSCNQQPNIQTINSKSTNLNQGFTGGYIAFYSYDYAAQLQHIKLEISPHSPQYLIGEYDIYFKYTKNKWQFYYPLTLKNHQVIQYLFTILQQPLIQKKEHVHFKLSHSMQARWNKHQYHQAFQYVQDYLMAGDCYQINLTQEFYSTIQSGTLITLLTTLLNLTQAPYAAYWSWQAFELLSCSPELFLEFQAGQLRTRPIKGTLPRHQHPVLDQKNREKLAHSEKDRAENLMIVDLLRNDLSHYAKIGSVTVPKLFEIESFAQVHHMVSEITAQLKSNSQIQEVLNAALPGGSITGAPKIRAMQIIQALEQANRGAYCGSIGYFNHDGSGRFNILIRTLQRYGDKLSVWAGGGITIASDCEAEYQECLDKVSALLNTLNQYVK